MKFFNLEMTDFTAAKSIHIYETEDGVRIENRKDKDKNVYMYDADGKLYQTIAPGSVVNL